MKGVSCVLALSLYVAAGTGAPSCKSDFQKDVDFAYSFKYPGGWRYAYMDSNNKLTKSIRTLDEASSSISNTIMQKDDSGVSYVIWNDEYATGGSSSAPNAHAKGLLLFTSAGGVWLTHSLPKFPLSTAKTAPELWSDASDDFGQSYLCITVTAAEIQKLGPLLLITRPSVYASKFATGAEAAFPDIAELAQKRTSWDTATMTKQVAITSKGGQTFGVFGKAGHWGVGKDLYRDLVAPSVGTLFMEGWRRGAGVWNAACGKDEVLDVLGVSFPGEAWDTMHDHSKWAVTQTGNTFCVGDLNRADGQDKRGGATVCIQDDSFAKQIRATITSEDKCSKQEATEVMV